MAWNAKVSGAYLNTSRQAIENVNEIYNLLTNLGWTPNAVAGLLGNIGRESGYNPWRWQSDYIPATSEWLLIRDDPNHGYGLMQYTPPGTYIAYSQTISHYPGYGPNWIDRSGNIRDGNAQLLCLHNDDRNGYIPTVNYPLTFTQFKQSTQSPEYLAAAFQANYERPSGGLDPARQTEARYWYDLFPRIIKEQRKSKWIYYIKRRDR